MGEETKSVRSASADTVLDDRQPPASPAYTSSIECAGGECGGGIVLRRKKPIAAWRLAIMFAWYVSFSLVCLGVNLVKLTSWKSIGMGLFLSLLDATVVATMLVDISSEFQDFKTSSWVVLAYTLTEVGMYSMAMQHSIQLAFYPYSNIIYPLTDLVAGFAVAMARLSDALGRKTIACISFAIFFAASLGCAAAANLDQLIGFRAVQGVGGAGLYSMAMITYPELSPPSRIVIVTSALGVIVALAGVCGPVIGGLLTTYVGWRYVFWIK